MQIALDRPARKFAFLAGAILVVGLFLTMAGRHFLAAHYATRAEWTRLQRAVHLAPGSAEYHQMLGRYLLVERNDVAGAQQQYLISTRLNPHSARSWFELAVIDQILDDVVGQRQALERAVQVDPTTPDLAWQAGNFFLVQGELEKALREFKVVVADEPGMVGEALNLCTRAADVDTILQQVLTSDPDAYLVFLELLTSKKDTAGAAKVWHALAQLGKRFDPRRALDYVNYLILHEELDEARIAWNDTARLCGLSAYLTSSNNLIVNPSFDSEILNSGFDWRYQKKPNVELALDPADFHAGHRSLAMVFDGPGVSDIGISQFVLVRPDTTYDFSAYYKAVDMDGAGGPRISISDAYSNAQYYLSDDLKNAEIWREASGRFKTASNAQLVVLRLLRIPENSPIRGKLWVDDFHLIEAQHQKLSGV